MSLSEEVAIGASILRADTVATSTCGITWVDVVSDSRNYNWVDGLVTDGLLLASVTDFDLAGSAYSDGLALSCLRVEVQVLVNTVSLSDRVSSDANVSSLIKNLCLSIAISPGCALAGR